MIVHVSMETISSVIVSAGDVCDVVPRMPVKGLLQAPLVQVMPDEAHTACQHKKAVQASMVNELIDLCILEGTTGPKHVNEASSNTTVHIQNKVGLLGRCDFLNTKCETQHFVAFEVLHRIFLDKLDAHIRVCLALDAVANSHDEDVVLLTVVD